MAEAEWTEWIELYSEKESVPSKLKHLREKYPDKEWKVRLVEDFMRVKWRVYYARARKGKKMGYIPVGDPLLAYAVGNAWQGDNFNEVVMGLMQEHKISKEKAEKVARVALEMIKNGWMPPNPF